MKCLIFFLFLNIFCQMMRGRYRIFSQAWVQSLFSLSGSKINFRHWAYSTGHFRWVTCTRWCEIDQSKNVAQRNRPVEYVQCQSKKECFTYYFENCYNDVITSQSFSFLFHIDCCRLAVSILGKLSLYLFLQFTHCITIDNRTIVQMNW